MKVALLNDQLNAGGAEKVLVNIANLLHKKGVDVSVVLFMSRSVLDGQLHTDIPMFYLNRKSRWDLAAMRSLKKIVQNFDIVHVHSRYNLRYFMAAKFVTGICRQKIVFHEHVPEFERLDIFTSLLFKRIDAYVAVLQSICNWAQSGNKVSKGKIFYLPNIVNPPAVPINREVFKSKKVLMAGNFRKVKNHLFAIKVIQTLGDGFTLDLLGTIEDQIYFDELDQYIKANNLAHQVNVIKGVSNIYEVLDQYHFALHPALLETGPLVLLEYMHAGLPFLAYDTGDVAENIRNTIPEVIMKTFDVNEWVHKIRSVILNNEDVALIKQKSTEIVNTYYTEDKYWERLHYVYQAALKQ